MHRILLLPGMTPDHRVFRRLLPLLPSAAAVDWIPPRPRESIATYAARLGETLPHREPPVVCGVSFGGVVARELAGRLNARTCVLISSVRSPCELPPWFRMCRPPLAGHAEPFLRAVGTLATLWPRRLRSPTTWRLGKLSGELGNWYRWATTALLNWKPSADAKRIPLTHIHGDHDTTFPLRYTNADTVIRGGGHLLTQTHSEKIASILRKLAR